MNSMNNYNLTTAAINSIIPEAYESNIALWIYTSLLSGQLVSIKEACTLMEHTPALPSYATLLKLPQEVEYIWFKPFSLPSFLYLMTRYASVIYQGFYFFLNVMPSSSRTCNILANAGNSMGFLELIGVQGLLVVRGYSICGGNKKLGAVLVFGVLFGAISYLYDIIANPGCETGSSSVRLLGLLTGVSAIFTDFLVLGICMWSVWGIWKLKKEVGIQSDHSLVSVLFKQSVLRCCFVTVITVSNTAMSVVAAPNHSPTIVMAGNILAYFQNSLSAILVADFTLDLRSLNSTKIEASQMSLPTLQFSNVLQHVHQSLLVELATPEDMRVADLESDDYDHDNPGFSAQD